MTPQFGVGVRRETDRDGQSAPVIDIVSGFLQEEKYTADGDPKFPKIQFPPEYLCPTCRLDDGSWDTPATLKFLLHYYGPHGPDVRGASVTAQSQQDLANSIQNGDNFKLQAPRRRPRSDSDPVRPPGDPGPGHVRPATPKDAAVVGGGAQGAPQVRAEKAGEEEAVPLDGDGSDGHWWKRLLWLLGIWLAVSLFCRCRWCES